MFKLHSKFSVHIICGCSLVLLRQRCNVYIGFCRWHHVFTL